MMRRHLFWLTALALALSGHTLAQVPVGELATSDASVKGAVVMTGGDTRVVSGSTVTAGATTATLHLARGGQVRICPGAALAVSASPNGGQLTLALGTGALETHYSLGSAADTIVTPDFRMLLAGPGEFHFAISADVRGNACVRALPSNGASMIVNEVFGDGAYQVRPQEQVLFRNGSVKEPSGMVPLDCGCPPPPPSPVQNLSVAKPIPPLPPASPPAQPTMNPQPPPPSSANDVLVQVDAPFVFNARDTVPERPAIARLQLQSMPALLMALPRVEPPPPPTPPTQGQAAQAKPPSQKKGFFGRIRSLFGGLFHSK